MNPGGNRPRVVSLSGKRRQAPLTCDFARILVCLLAALSPACARVIAWPSVEPDQDLVRCHITSMEAKPFDGVVLQATGRGAGGRAGLHLVRIWLDFDSGAACRDQGVAGRPCRWFDPSLYPVEGRAVVDPEQLATAVASARAVSDGYVWIYTTEPKWWTEERPLGENLPDAYVQALQRGREAAALSCPRAARPLPGEALPGMNR